MNRSVTATTAILALTCAVWAQDPSKESPYYPLKKGTTWTFKAPTKMGGAQTITVQVTGGDKDGAKVETIIKDKDGKDKSVASETVVVQDDGLYRTTVNGVKSDAPVRFLKLPPKKGESWEVETKIQGQAVKGTFSADEEEVTVPAGKYKAIKVEAKDFSVAGLKTTIACWYAEKVGIVKQSFRVGDTEVVLELEKFAEGK
jgi:hypothetical protein